MFHSILLFDIFFYYRVVFKTTTKNGGYIDYIDREQNADKRYYINGISEELVFELEYDYVLPGHCYETDNSCSKEALDIDDFNTSVSPKSGSRV